ncbi:MAG TPA: 3-isopropylmalate dehydratase small subunit [Xanthomonadales bacterium]|nr:3-isopropylmalate dehydratase small subunit [Xanthomonadales bacterium]
MSASGIIETRTFNLPFDNIDTDQIIPAQFLTTTERDGLGQFCFYHWRFNPDGGPRENDPLKMRLPQQQALVAGANFGCGSSREHAPWALLDLGFRVIISSKFADIFRNNALKNGLLPLAAEQPVIDFLLAHPDHRVRINIPAMRLEVNGLGSFDFPLDPFAAHCLAQGIDQLDFILQHEKDIARYEQGIER